MTTILRTALVFLLLAPAVAAAQSETPDALLERGLALRREGRDDEALALFRRANEMDPSARALTQIALAEQAMGLWVEAHAHLADALAQGSDPWIAERRAALEASLAGIEEHLGRLEVAGGLDGATITIDGTARGTLPLAEPLWVPAGELVVEVRAEGHHAFTRRIDVREGGRARVTVQLVRAEEPPPAEVPPVGVAPAGGGDPAVSIAGGVLLGVGAIGLGVAIGFHAERERNAALFNDDSLCEPDEPGEMRSQMCPDQHRAITDAEVGMGIGYAVGGALAIAGVALLIAGATSGGGESASIACAPGVLGASCRGRF